MPVTESHDLTALAATIQSHRYRYDHERELHEALARCLTDAGHTVAREVRLSERDRIDFLVNERIGIEVKVQGGPSSVLGQLGRYARHETIAGLLLVSDRMQLGRIAATAINGKPFRAVLLLGGLA